MQHGYLYSARYMLKKEPQWCVILGTYNKTFSGFFFFFSVVCVYPSFRLMSVLISSWSVLPECWGSQYHTFECTFNTPEYQKLFEGDLCCTWLEWLLQRLILNLFIYVKVTLYRHTHSYVHKCSSQHRSLLLPFLCICPGSFSWTGWHLGIPHTLHRYPAGMMPSPHSGQVLTHCLQWATCLCTSRGQNT